MRNSRSLRMCVLTPFASGSVLLVVLVYATLPWVLSVVFAVEHGLELTAVDGKPETDRNVATRQILPAGPYHQPLRIQTDARGIRDPQFSPIANSTENDSVPVIGFVVMGQPFAFACRSMFGPSQHIVNFVTAETPVSVTYCGLSDCARVLTRDPSEDGSEELIDLRMGGLDVENQMVILLDEIRYGHMSSALPLSDHPFERTTLGDWKRRYPASQLYPG